MKISIKLPVGYVEADLELDGEYVSDEAWVKLSTDDRFKAIENALTANVEYECIKSYDECE
jgi:hypothetical protein